jgi:hypothetical protein
MASEIAFSTTYSRVSTAYCSGPKWDVELGSVVE